MRIAGADVVPIRWWLPYEFKVAHVPFAEIFGHESNLKSLTQSKGVALMAVERLEICSPHVQETVTRESGFMGMSIQQFTPHPCT